MAVDRLRIDGLRSYGVLVRWILLSLTLATIVFKTIRVVFNPVGRLPGPWYSRFTHLVLLYHNLKGSRTRYIHSLHLKYGPVVRLSPIEVSVADIPSIKIIYSAKDDYLKTEWYQKFTVGNKQGMFTTPDKQFHRQRRKMLTGPLTLSALTSLYPIIVARVDLAMDKMRVDFQSKGYTDVHKWWHFLTTDIIGELTFGESFRMLELGKVRLRDIQSTRTSTPLTRGTNSPASQKTQYIEDLKQAAQLGAVKSGLPRIVTSLFAPGLGKKIIALQYNIQKYAEESLGRHADLVARGSDKADRSLFIHLFEAYNDGKLAFEDIRREAQTNIFAGSDTTANTLCYLVWCVCQRPQIRDALVRELQTLPADFNDAHVRELPYLGCVIQETLRLWTAVPSSLPRYVPAGGAILAGQFIPEGVTVSSQAFTLHRDENLFPDAEAFDPSRWIQPTDAMKEAMMPFGRGPRACIGLHLAQLELRRATACFFLEFPNAVPSSKEGMGPADMEPKTHFLLYPSGHRCLIEAPSAGK